MAQTRKRRSTKHRGNAAGMIEARGRTGRRPDPADKKSARTTARGLRERKPPQWRSAINRAALSAVVLFALLVLLLGQGAAAGFGLAVAAFVIYVPISYVTDSYLYRRGQRKPEA